MADQKETIILELKVDQGDMISDLERGKRSIIGLKQEQKELNDAYKKGAVTLEEYASESVRLEQILKKESATYNDLSKKVTGHKSATDKLIESNNKLAKSNTDLSGKFQNVAGNINIAGTNLGSLTSGMGAFLNPATAAASIVGTLATAYFNTGRGAQDLEAIQFKLQATTEVLSNKVADLVDKFKGADGKGLGSFFIEAIPGAQLLAGVFQATVGKEIDDLAKLKSQMDDLNQAQADARTLQNNLLEDNSGLLEEINRQETSYNDKVFLAGQMKANVQAGAQAILDIKNQELALLEQELTINKDSEVLQRAISAKKLEISQEERKREKLVNNILKMEDNLATINEKQLEQLREKAALEQQIAEHKAAQIAPTDLDPQAAIDAQVQKNEEDIRSMLITTGLTLETDKLSASVLKKADADVKAANASAKATQANRDRTGSLIILSNAIGGAAAIFEKNTIASKALSAAQAGINSYLAGTEVLKDPTFIGRPVQRVVAMVATIAAGLAQQGKILGAFAGGGSFETKGPTWLLVGDNPGGRERVDVKPLSGKGQTKIFNDGAAMAGGGSINGSILAASQTNPIDAQMGIESALSTPQTVQFVESDYVRFRNKLTFKEQLTEV